MRWKTMSNFPYVYSVYRKSANADDNNNNNKVDDEEEEGEKKKNCFSDLLYEAIWNDKGMEEWESEKRSVHGFHDMHTRIHWHDSNE